MYLGMYGVMLYLHDQQSMGVLGDVLFILVSSVGSHRLFSYSVCVSGEREREIKWGGLTTRSCFLLTLGTHAQRGLRYLVCVSVV